MAQPANALCADRFLGLVVRSVPRGDAGAAGWRPAITKERLAVYAVSIDKNLNRWKQAVEADGSGTAMTHVILRKDNPDCDRLFRMFGIETIPHNFLLDADGKIVAVDRAAMHCARNSKSCNGNNVSGNAAEVKTRTETIFQMLNPVLPA